MLPYNLSGGSEEITKYLIQNVRSPGCDFKLGQPEFVARI
jgi:hypothetical protein